MFFCVSTDGPNVSALIFAYTLKMGARCGIIPWNLPTQTSKHGYRGLLIHPHLSSDRCEPWRMAGQRATQPLWSSQALQRLLCCVVCQPKVIRSVAQRRTARRG